MKPTLYTCDNCGNEYLIEEDDMVATVLCNQID